jgi:hypothetical protein
MGFDLIDSKNQDDGFSINFWHWHAIVNLILSLNVLPEEKVATLHEQFVGTGLSAEEARIVAAEIRSQILPKLDKSARVSFDGFALRTDHPENNVHCTSLDALEKFVAYCERSNGFTLS